MLRLSSGGIMSRLHGGGARGLLASADRSLSRELKSVRSAEIALSSFAFGVLQGRYKKQGGLTLLLPIDVMAGAAFHVLAMFMPKYSHHLHALGDGAIASFTTTVGYRVGERTAEGAGLLKSISSGMFGDAKAPAGGSSIADKELASLVRAE